MCVCIRACVYTCLLMLVEMIQTIHTHIYIYIYIVQRMWRGDEKCGVSTTVSDVVFKPK